MNNLKYTIELDFKGKLLPGLKIVRQQIDNVTDSVRKTNGQFKNMANICERLRKMNYSHIADNWKNVTDSFSTLSQSGVDFEQSLADLQAITGITGRNLEVVAQTARKVGRESGLGAKGAVDAFTLLASQINIDKIGIKELVELQKRTITLAQAGGLEMTEAATAMAATINQFGLSASEANRVINVLAAGSKYGAAEVADLAQSFKVSGATAAAAGVSVEQTAGAIEVLSQMNLKGAEAGTALRNIILKMQTTLGMDLKKTAMADALDQLKPKLDDTTYLAKVFGVENIAAAQYLIKNAAAVREMTQAVTGTSTAQEQASIRTQTTAEQIKRIQANIENLKISLFEATGGLTGYASALGGTVVMLSQMLPLFALLKNGTATVTGAIVTLAMSMGDNLVTVFNAAKVSLLEYTVQAQYLSGVILTRLATGFAAFTRALAFQNVAAKAAAAATALLNAVMNANPIVLVVTAIAALAAGLVYAYKNSERFRNVVDSVWASVSRFFSLAWNKIVGWFKSIYEWAGKAWGKVKQFFGFGQVDIPEEPENNKTSGPSTVNSGIFDTVIQESKLALNTVGGLTKKIQELREAQNKASLEQAVNLEKEIRLYQKKLEEMQKAIVAGVMGNIADNRYKETIEAPGISAVDVPEISIPVEFDQRAIQRSWEITRQQLQESRREIQITGEQIGQMLTGSMQNFFASIGEAVASGDGMEVLKSALVSIMDLLQQFGAALVAAGTASLALKAVAWNGVGAIIAGGALIAATAAAKAALQKAATPFAKGGIVSGPTYALVGEYAGASGNPEVIAPLDKLKNLIEPTAPAETMGEVRFVIRGEVLEGILQKMNRKRSRTR